MDYPSDRVDFLPGSQLIWLQQDLNTAFGSPSSLWCKKLWIYCHTSWRTFVIPALRRLRLEVHGFKVSLGYIVSSKPKKVLEPRLEAKFADAEFNAVPVKHPSSSVKVLEFTCS
jgi:hypothetical protein